MRMSEVEANDDILKGTSGLQGNYGVPLRDTKAGELCFLPYFGRS